MDGSADVAFEVGREEKGRRDLGMPRVSLKSTREETDLSDRSPGSESAPRSQQGDQSAQRAPQHLDPCIKCMWRSGHIFGTLPDLLGSHADWVGDTCGHESPFL